MPLTVDEAGTTQLDPAGVREGLFADCDEEGAQRATALLRPEPGSIFTKAPARAAWKDTPSTYIAGRDDGAILPEMVAQFAQRCDAALTWPTSHSPTRASRSASSTWVHDHL